jgi:hypothetical protein
MIATIKKHAAIIFIFSCTVITGLFTYQDYGISWDEVSQWNIGRINYEYVFYGSNELLTAKDKDYGPGYELPLYLLEKALGLSDSRDIYLMRHLVSHLFFLCSMLVGYVLIYRLFRNRLIACLGFIMLVFHPRIYAHSFFNTKDLPFLSMVFLCLAGIYVMFRKDKMIGYTLVGLLVGYACSMRIMGIMLPGFVSLFFLFDILRAKKNKFDSSPLLKRYGLFIASALAMLYLSWPYLWSDPVGHFAECYRSFSHYRWDGAVMFNGSVRNASSLPWTYIPQWMGVTTPVLWLLTAVAGLVLLIADIAGRPHLFIANGHERNFVLVLLAFLAPLLAVLILHSTVYDDWRHLYFIYPPMVITGLYAINYFMERGHVNFIKAACAIQVLLIAFAMVESHPFQQVYFNRLVSHKEGALKKKFEMEYWGCSYKRGLEWLADSIKAGSIRVNTITPLNNNVLLLPHTIRQRFVQVAEGDKPYYLLTNYRFVKEDSLYLPLVHRISAGNSPIMDIYLVEK